eukprot:scaffold17094_cov121-Isochrysis_galbana.AAC.2
MRRNTSPPLLGRGRGSADEGERHTLARGSVHDPPYNLYVLCTTYNLCALAIGHRAHPLVDHGRC